MIASILLFALGFLCASVVALLVVPAIWRRAVRLTIRRIEASVPLTANEIRAEKDKLRAAYAMTTRRMEMQTEALQARHAGQLLRIAEQEARERSLTGDSRQKDIAFEALRKDNEGTVAELRLREEDIQRLSIRLDEAEQQGRASAAAMESLECAASSANLDAANRQIEMVAREAQVEKLAGDIDLLREEARAADRRGREAETKRLAAEEALMIEKRRTAEMNGKLEKLMAALADKEQSLEEHARQTEALHAGKGVLPDENEKLNAALADSETRRQALEAELAGISGQLESLISGAKAEQLEKAMEKLDAERRLLEEKLAALTQENEKLRAGSPSASETQAQRREDALLREQISNLAAEVIHLTAMMEGPGSAIQEALDLPPPAAVAGAVASLGERVKALQKASAMR